MGSINSEYMSHLSEMQFSYILTITALRLTACTVTACTVLLMVTPLRGDL